MLISKIKKAAMFMVLSTLSIQPLHAADWSPQTIKIVVPFAAGGTTDILGRLIAENMSVELNTNVIVENTPGANGNIGAAAVARAKPDGQTLLLGTPGPMIVNKYVYDSLLYDPKTAFQPIGLIAALPNVVMVSPNLGVDSVQDLIKLGKEKTDLLSHGSPGVGSSGHVSTELFKQNVDLSAVHVPYKGSVPMLTDLISGETDFTIDQISSALSFIQAGNLKALAVTSKTRSAQLPDVPTMQEAGIENYEVSVWFCLTAPANTPEHIVTALNAALNKALEAPEVQARLASYGAEARPGSPEDLQNQIDSEEVIIAAVSSQVDLKN